MSLPDEVYEFSCEAATRDELRVEVERKLRDYFGLHDSERPLDHLVRVTQFTVTDESYVFEDDTGRTAQQVSRYLAEVGAMRTGGDTVKVLLVGDIHLSDRPPSARRETYAEEVFAKLEQTVTLANEGAADAVVWAGDVFHIKIPSRTSHWIVQRTIELLKRYEAEAYCAVGNHDLRHDELSTLDSQPLGTVFAAGVATELTGEVSVPGGKLFGIPYLKNWDRDLHKHMEAWARSDAPLMVTHAPIVPNGVSLPYETIDAARWVERMGRVGDVYYGHMHHCDGDYVAATTERGEFRFCNQGALSRGSLHESTLERKPAVTWWEDGVFERVEIDHLPADEAFELHRVEEEKSAEARLDAFLEALDSTTLRRVSAEEIAADLAEREDVDENVREAVTTVLEAVME